MRRPLVGIATVIAHHELAPRHTNHLDPGLGGNHERPGAAGPGILARARGRAFIRSVGAGLFAASEKPYHDYQRKERCASHCAAEP